jgi:RNA polymerase primary sigma factor
MEINMKKFETFSEFKEYLWDFLMKYDNEIAQEQIYEVINKKFKDIDEEEIDLLFDELRTRDVVFTDELIDEEDLESLDDIKVEDEEEDEEKIDSLSAEEMRNEIKRAKKIASNAKSQTTVKYRVGGISTIQKFKILLNHTSTKLDHQKF